LTELRQLNIRVDAAVVEQLKLQAAEQGLSLNQLLTRILTAVATNGQYGNEPSSGVEQRLARVEQRLDAVEQQLQRG
jgi:hypothetical protein